MGSSLHSRLERPRRTPNRARARCGSPWPALAALVLASGCAEGHDGFGDSSGSGEWPDLVGGSTTTAGGTSPTTGLGETTQGEGTGGASESGESGEVSDLDPNDDPLPQTPPGQWNWYDFPASSCSDGSPAGLSVRYGTIEKLVINLGHGNACFNSLTCTFTNAFVPGDLKQGRQTGLFNAIDANNPVADWHHVDVPYCTGDVHGGWQPELGSYPGTQNRSFTGALNVEHFLARLVPTFGHVQQILLTGSSAGGFGALTNYLRVRAAFGDVPVTMIDDSGVPLPEPQLAPCLQRQFRELWQLETAYLGECDACNTASDGGGLQLYLDWLAQHDPTAQLAYIASHEDEAMRAFWGFGNDECAALDGFVVPQLPPGVHTEGLLNLTTRLRAGGRWSTYLIPGDGHAMFLSDEGFFQTVIDDVPLPLWVEEVLDGQIVQVGD